MRAAQKSIMVVGLAVAMCILCSCSPSTTVREPIELIAEESGSENSAATRNPSLVVAEPQFGSYLEALQVYDLYYADLFNSFSIGMASINTAYSERDENNWDKDWVFMCYEDIRNAENALRVFASTDINSAIFVEFPALLDIHKRFVEIADTGVQGLRELRDAVGNPVSDYYDEIGIESALKKCNAVDDLFYGEIYNTINAAIIAVCPSLDMDFDGQVDGIGMFAEYGYRSPSLEPFE